MRLALVTNGTGAAQRAKIERFELAHRFEVVTVADGVENESDLRALQSMDCDAGQGPYLAEPMPKSQFISALRERARSNQAWLA